MQLAARGHPLHTRALTVELRQGEAPGTRLEFRGQLLDLRKRGFVPVAGDLQAAGVVHDMRISGVLDPATGSIESIEAAQPTVAFEASAATQGECCRDPLDLVQSLVGARIDEPRADAHDLDLTRRLRGVLGGPLACSHILTLAHLIGSTLRRAVRIERACPGEVSRVAGERIFRRDLVCDGFELEGSAGAIQLAIQLGDLHFAPASASNSETETETETGTRPTRPMDRFGSQLELRALAEIDTKSMTLLDISAAERRRTLADLEHADWSDRSPALAPLAGLALRPGVAAALLRHLGSPDEPTRAESDDLPLLDALLNLTPAVFQCLAVLSEDWPLLAKQRPSVVGVGGMRDSCYMWRSGGALDRARGRGRHARLLLHVAQWWCARPRPRPARPRWPPPSNARHTRYTQ
jgi:hypothetical protein